MKKRSLQIDEDIDFQRKEWLVQRIGIALLSLFVLAALLGLTGQGGPLNHGEAGDRNGPIHVEYERVVRRGAKSSLRLRFRSTTTDHVRFWVSTPYLERVTMETIVPHPDIESIEDGRHVFTISTKSSDVPVTLEMEHETMGRVGGEVGVVGGPSVSFSQWSLF